MLCSIRVPHVGCQTVFSNQCSPIVCQTLISKLFHILDVKLFVLKPVQILDVEGSQDMFETVSHIDCRTVGLTRCSRIVFQSVVLDVKC